MEKDVERRIHMKEVLKEHQKVVKERQLQEFFIPQTNKNIKVKS